MKKAQQPLEFELEGRTYKEYVPRTPSMPIRIILIARVKIIIKFSGRISYFHFRHDFAPEAIKMQDIAFISHYSRSHDNNKNASILECYRNYWYMRKYAPELKYIASEIRKRDIDKAPKHVMDYMRKWEPYGQPAPYLVEFFHGLDKERMHYWWGNNKV